MKQMYIILFGILLISSVGFTVDSIDAVPSDKFKISKHIIPDNIHREKQSFDIKDIEKGSQIKSAYAIFTLDEFIGDQCVLILDEQYLKKDNISAPFICEIGNAIPLKINGIHALQSKINSEQFDVIVKSDTNGLVAVTSNNIQLTMVYSSPTYFAEIQNDIVTNVIVSEPNFIDGMSGEWIETGKTIRGHYARIGDSYNRINDMFISPQPYNSWILNELTGFWQPPTPIPEQISNRIEDKIVYHWDEALEAWVE